MIVLFFFAGNQKRRRKEERQAQIEGRSGRSGLIVRFFFMYHEFVYGIFFQLHFLQFKLNFLIY